LRPSLLLAASIAALAAAPVGAQNVTYDVNAQITPVCGVYSSAGTVIDVNFGSLADVATSSTVSVGAGSATYRCNTRTGFTRTITSQNNGWLTLEGNPTTEANRRIRFNMQHGGGSGMGFPTQQLTAPLSRSFPGNPTWLLGQTGGVTFHAFGVRAAPSSNGLSGTTVLSGNYRDTVTITVTAN
jgi:spore coat protein U-like protein